MYKFAQKFSIELIEGNSEFKLDEGFNFSPVTPDKCSKEIKQLVEPFLLLVYSFVKIIILDKRISSFE